MPNAVQLINNENKNLTNPIHNVKQEIRKYWSKEEIDYKINQITNQKDGMLIRFLWMTGTRITEAITLDKQRIDFKNYVMVIRWLKSRKYFERVVPIHPKLKDLLQLYTAQFRQEDRIFPYSRQRAWQIVQRWMGGHPHQLRHSFAVHWLRSGGDIITLHRILGHSKVQTTMEYLKIVPIDQGKELIKINFD
jgi:integrase